MAIHNVALMITTNKKTMNKKLTKLQKKIKKEQFFEEYSMAILSKYGTKVEFHQHFIKIKMGGVVCDYYPGGERLNKIVNNGYDWSDLSNEEFLKMIGIKSFNTDALNDFGIFNDL